MKLIAVPLGVALLGIVSPASTQALPEVVQLDGVEWRGNGGLQTAVIEGNPQAVGQQFTMLLKLQDSAWIQPHTHNISKRLLVVSGQLLVGYGSRLDKSDVVTLEVGDFLVVPSEVAHFEGGSGETIVALYGVGPFRTTMLPQTKDE